MTDQMEKLFADLRAETLPTVRPPGTAPLRRAARRRQAALTGAAALTVLAMAGLFAVVRPDDVEPAPVAAPATTPTPAVYSEKALAQEVKKGLGIETEQLSRVFTKTAQGPLSATHQLLGGTWELRLNCFGAGTMDVSATTGGEPGQEPRVVEANVRCEAGARPYLTLDVAVPDPSSKLTLRIVPDVTGPGRAAVGYALALKPADKARWQEAAADVLGENPAGQVQAGAQFVTDGGVGYDPGTISPGRYRVRAVCLGFGTVNLNVGVGQAGDATGTYDETVLRCSPTDPTPGIVTYQASRSLYYDVDPRPDSRGRTAVATVLETY